MVPRLQKLPLTSVHDTLGVHVLERGAELRKVLPDGALGDEALLLLEVLDHAGEVPGISQLQHDVQLVVLHEGGQVFDHVRVVKLLQKNKQQLSFKGCVAKLDGRLRLARLVARLHATEAHRVRIQTSLKKHEKGDFSKGSGQQNKACQKIYFQVSIPVRNCGLEFES